MEGVERGIVEERGRECNGAEVNEKQFTIFSLSVVKLKRPRKRKQVSKVCKDHFYLRDKFSLRVSHFSYNESGSVGSF